MEYNVKFMRKAIALSVENIKRGGGPFGAVIVKDGKIVAMGVNRVTANTDPTAHAEVNVIRKAAKKLVERPNNTICWINIFEKYSFSFKLI